MNATDDYNSSQGAARNCLEISYGLDKYVPVFLPPLQFTLFAIYFGPGVLLNGTIVLLVCRYKALHQRDFFVALQVIVADLILVLCLPLAMGTLYGRVLILAPVLCYVVACVKLFVNFLRFMMMFVHTLDRFCSVFLPFSYARYGRRFCACLSAAAWISAILAASVPFAIDCYGYQPTFGFCMIQPFCSRMCKAFAYVFACVMITFGGIIPTLLYILMFLKAREMAKRNTGSLQVSGTTPNRSRPRITFAWLLVTFIGCSVPVVVVMVTWTPLYDTHTQIFIVFFGLSMTVFEAIVVADPIMILRNRDLKAVLWGALKRFRGWLGATNGAGILERRQKESINLSFLDMQT